MKKVIKLSEEKVKSIIMESVKRVLNEMGEYSDVSKLVAELHPLYKVLANDGFGYDEEPKDSPMSLSAAKSMLKILNEYFGGDYFEIVRGGADVIITNNGWFNGEYDLADVWYNYSISVKSGTPDEVDEEAGKIANYLELGAAPRSMPRSHEIDGNSEGQTGNGGLKVLGKIDLSKIDPKGMNKKRW